MTLAQFAPFADLLAALGVMLTVAFLAFELRATRKQTQLSNWRELLQTLVDFKGLTNDLEFADFVERGHQDYDALSPAERRAFGMYLEQGIHIIGNFRKHNDSLPRKLEGLDGATSNLFVDLLDTPGGRAWWVASRPNGRFMPETYKVVDGVLQRGRIAVDQTVIPS